MTQEVVRAGKMPGKMQEIPLEGKMMLSDVLKKGELSPEGYEVRLNGSPSEMNALVNPGDTIILVKKIKGNPKMD